MRGLVGSRGSRLSPLDAGLLGIRKDGRSMQTETPWCSLTACERSGLLYC